MPRKTVCVADSTNMKASSITNSFPCHSFNNATIIIRSTNSIQEDNLNFIKEEERVITKAILGKIVNAIYLAKGNVKSSTPSLRWHRDACSPLSPKQ